MASGVNCNIKKQGLDNVYILRFVNMIQLPCMYLQKYWQAFKIMVGDLSGSTAYCSLQSLNACLSLFGPFLWYLQRST